MDINSYELSNKQLEDITYKAKITGTTIASAGTAYVAYKNWDTVGPVVKTVATRSAGAVADVGTQYAVGGFFGILTLPQIAYKVYQGGSIVYENVNYYLNPGEPSYE